MLIGLLAALGLAAGVAVPAAEAREPAAREPAEVCHETRQEVVLPDGPAPDQFRPRTDLTATVVDARGVVWRNQELPPGNQRNYPVALDGPSDRSVTAQAGGVCFVGGRIESDWPDEAPPTRYDWDFWHGTTGLMVTVDHARVHDTTIVAQGDGIDLQGADWLVEGVLLRRIHDDCIQNDAKETGTVSGALLDGCYSAFSAEHPRAQGRDRTMTIEDTLVRLQAMRSPWQRSGTPYQGPGSGPFFKWDEDSPGLVIRDSTFRADALPAVRTLDVPEGARCEGDNTFVWGGPLPAPRLPDSLLDCFRATADPAVWEDAVARWEDRAR